MLKVYYCINCKKTMYISREVNTICRRCSTPMLKLDISYEQFGLLGEKEREALINEERMQADLVVTGTIFTGEGTIKEAMAIKNGTITYVGNKKDVQVMIGTRTHVIDVQGMVVPGFTEGHAHVTSTYEILNYAPLFKGETKDEYIKLLKDFLQKHPDTEFLMGRGYRNGVFDSEGPKACMLDEVSREIPIVTIGEDAHSMWVNTTALKLAGIDKYTKEVPGGEIVRYADGTPTGWLKEAADSLMQPVLPRLQPDKVKEAILHYQKLALDNGITHVFEPMLNPQRDYDVCVRAYEELAQENQLLLNYQVGYTIYPGNNIDEGLSKAAEYRKRAETIGSDRYSLNTIKLFIDGVLEGHTAYLLESYKDQPDCQGEPLWTQERLDEAVIKASREHFQVHIHTIGDGALDMAIHAFAAAKKAGCTVDAPHAVTHVQVVAKEQFQQLAELGIAVVVNPYWHVKDHLYYDNLEKPFLGEERAEKEYPVASFVNAGCVVSQASDFPVTVPADIMTSLHIMVNRGEHKYGDFEPLNPEEALSVEQALTVMTINGAKQGGIEAVTGSLKEGKGADFVILNKNLLTIEPSQLYTAMVQQIFIKGSCIKKND